MSRLQIVHRTGFTYEEPATASYNEARMLPRSHGGQFVLQAALEISPQATQNSYADYWENQVSTFEVLVPHKQLTVTATSIVDVRAAPRYDAPFSWEALAEQVPTSTALAEALMQTNATKPDDEMRTLAEHIVLRGGDVGETAFAICQAVGEAMSYRRGVTGVTSTARDAWPTRSGVCQDIAHISLGILRAAGIPARYVSGYLLPDADAPVGQAISGESHAWVEWFAGQWCGYDPTNRAEIGEGHVYVGHGRDYSDVAPLRGVYAGPSSSGMFVSVELTRWE